MGLSLDHTPFSKFIKFILTLSQKKIDTEIKIYQKVKLIKTMKEKKKEIITKKIKTLNVGV